MSSPFRITVYSGAFERIGWVGNPLSVTTTPRHLAVGTASFTIRNDHRLAAALMTNGTRVVIEYDGQHLISGPRRGWSGDMASRSLTFTVEDDFRLMHRILGWPVPGSAIGAQSGSEYHTVTNSAETVAKTILGANATRLGLPLTVASDLDRGATVTVQVRQHPIGDRLLPILDTAGIGLTVRQVGAGLVLDCYEPAVYPRTLSAASGVIRDWSITVAGPKATRAVVGGGGEGTAREFRAVTDSALEAEWSDVIEVFVDARDTNDNAVLDARGTQAIAEGAPTQGLSVTLAETAHFRYGTAVSVGDQVTLTVGPGLTVTDVLREATVSWTADQGLRVVPTVGRGDSNDPITITAQAISALARGQRNQNARS